jgi:hypothetical protein
MSSRNIGCRRAGAAKAIGFVPSIACLPNVGTTVGVGVLVVAIPTPVGAIAACAGGAEVSGVSDGSDAVHGGHLDRERQLESLARPATAAVHMW